MVAQEMSGYLATVETIACTAGRGMTSRFPEARDTTMSLEMKEMTG
jgi:hypothetical protein